MGNGKMKEPPVQKKEMTFEEVVAEAKKKGYTVATGTIDSPGQMLVFADTFERTFGTQKQGQIGQRGPQVIEAGFGQLGGALLMTFGGGWLSSKFVGEGRLRSSGRWSAGVLVGLGAAELIDQIPGINVPFAGYALAPIIGGALFGIDKNGKLAVALLSAPGKALEKARTGRMTGGLSVGVDQLLLDRMLGEARDTWRAMSTQIAQPFKSAALTAAEAKALEVANVAELIKQKKVAGYVTQKLKDAGLSFDQNQKLKGTNVTFEQFVSETLEGASSPEEKIGRIMAKARDIYSKRDMPPKLSKSLNSALEDAVNLMERVKSGDGTALVLEAANSELEKGGMAVKNEFKPPTAKKPIVTSDGVTSYLEAKGQEPAATAAKIKAIIEQALPEGISDEMLLGEGFRKFRATELAINPGAGFRELLRDFLGSKGLSRGAELVASLPDEEIGKLESAAVRAERGKLGLAGETASGAAKETGGFVKQHPKLSLGLVGGVVAGIAGYKIIKSVKGKEDEARARKGEEERRKTVPPERTNENAEQDRQLALQKELDEKVALMVPGVASALSISENAAKQIIATPGAAEMLELGGTRVIPFGVKGVEVNGPVGEESGNPKPTVVALNDGKSVYSFRVNFANTKKSDGGKRAILFGVEGEATFSPDYYKNKTLNGSPLNVHLATWEGKTYLRFDNETPGTYPSAGSIEVAPGTPVDVKIVFEKQGGQVSFLAVAVVGDKVFSKGGSFSYPTGGMKVISGSGYTGGRNYFDQPNIVVTPG